MAQENRSAILVIEAWIFIRDEEEAKLTDLRNCAAEESHEASSQPVGREKLVETKKSCSISNQSREIGKELNQSWFAVVKVGDWT